ncbi:AraC family transcriptional regulator [Bordetella genomosp. 5]|uniref:HTH araC/xylS-type domain-containing protein n=1 Tax=Bordetella genomosp. 5 TaxID=1395608 RepID=A0A261THW3_9BORD|nr:helix-turn-helix transcriptional regulator [Bordetella genomosp. 5]OZI39654.1 AraC family transcriptional regulator [Bordetella genomosp. 5]OZI49005.1 hypothetical protein CAL25_15390 [Bordetella genomosp. 5]
MHGQDAKPYDTATSILTGAAANFTEGHETPFHCHARCQLLYAVEGLMRVDTPGGRWLVPPARAVWISPWVEHRMSVRGPARIRSLFVDSQRVLGLPATDGMIPVSPLLRAVIDELASLGLQAIETRRGRLMAHLLREELSAPMDPAFHLPWPTDKRIRQVCEALSVEGERRDWDAAHWADALAMSVKTFQRHFQKQTSTSFGQWRLRARLLSSLQGLMAGDSILQVALACGYASQSAFTLAFRRHFGMAPSAFQAQSHAGVQA